MVRPYYTRVFFSGQVLQKASYVRIELDHVYRQKEQALVDLLNEVRNQSISAQSLALLNAPIYLTLSQVRDFKEPAKDQGSLF